MEAVPLETNAGHFPVYPTPNTQTTKSTPVSPLSDQGSWQTEPLLPHPRIGGPQPGHKSLLLSYLGSQAPTQAAQESLPAPGQISALVSDGASSQSMALGPLSISLLGTVFLFAQQPC